MYIGYPAYVLTTVLFLPTESPHLLAKWKTSYEEIFPKLDRYVYPTYWQH